MEFLSQSIEKAIKDPKDPINYTKVMLGMFDAIHCLHKVAKYVHKDIKPDNFLIQDG
jgi:serine/threonine protein kinase